MLRWFPQPYFRPALCSADRRVQDAGNYDDPRLEAFVAAFSLSSERSLLVDLMTDRTGNPRNPRHLDGIEGRRNSEPQY